MRSDSADIPLIAAKYKIPLSDRICGTIENRRSFNCQLYDGHTVATRLSASEPVPAHILHHEMAHWVAATKLERKLDNFGLDPIGLRRSTIHPGRAIQIGAGIITRSLQEFREVCARIMQAYWRSLPFASQCNDSLDTILAQAPLGGSLSPNEFEYPEVAKAARERMRSRAIIHLRRRSLIPTT